MEEKEMTLSERHKDEIFTNNTLINSYPQCRDCLFRGVEINGEWINDGDRSHCRIFSQPYSAKPYAFYLGEAVCEYYEKDKKTLEAQKKAFRQRVLASAKKADSQSEPNN